MTPAASPHNVIVNADGIIEVTMGASITRKNLQELIEGSYLIAQSMDDRNDPIYIIADVSAVRRVDRHITSLGRKAFEDLPLTRMAMFGAGPAVTAAMNTIMALSSKRGKVKLFRTQAEAAGWLGLPPKRPA